MCPRRAFLDRYPVRPYRPLSGKEPRLFWLLPFSLLLADGVDFGQFGDRIWTYIELIEVRQLHERMRRAGNRCRDLAFQAMGI
ncbi:hypothetical protein [Thermosporothrix hazakensis]|uniref:hypothetical protein n=1 Tax=Thermosporothrix hazakensis TaxID=644383 RepID=UPI0010F44CD7|nr:hypothetical protein [Thermosporothrix hazakensis]